MPTTTAAVRFGRRVGSAGARAHCLEDGPPGAPTVLLIHGLGGLAQEIAAPLSAGLRQSGLRVLAIDRPGYGHSDPRPAEEMGPAGQAAWLLTVLDTLQVRPTLILAHSFGAAVALWLACALGPSAPRLVLVNPFCRPTPPARAPLLRLSMAPGVGRIVRRRVAPPLSNRLVRWHLCHACAPDPPPVELQVLPPRIVMQESAIMAMAAELRAFNADEARLPDERDHLRQPIVALTGASDRVLAGAAHGAWLAANFACVEHRAAPSGHMLHHTRPELVMAAALQAR